MAKFFYRIITKSTIVVRLLCLVKIDLSIRERWIVFWLSLTAIAVHLINLGITPLMADEAIRATVAFEMMKSNDYIVPTIWGEFYYRKPPLYNWIIVGFFKLFDSYSEFVFRLPSVIPLFLMGLAMWFVSRKHIGSKAGVIAAFGFILSGRLLTRDSMLGHIDIAFSLDVPSRVSDCLCCSVAHASSQLLSELFSSAFPLLLLFLQIFD